MVLWVLLYQALLGPRDSLASLLWAFLLAVFWLKTRWLGMLLIRLYRLYFNNCILRQQNSAHNWNAAMIWPTNNPILSRSGLSLQQSSCNEWGLPEATLTTHGVLLITVVVKSCLYFLLVNVPFSVSRLAMHTYFAVQCHAVPVLLEAFEATWVNVVSKYTIILCIIPKLNAQVFPKRSIASPFEHLLGFASVQ